MVDVGVEDVASCAVGGWLSVADATVPGGARWACSAGVEILLEDTNVAGAADTVEEGVGRAFRNR